MDSLSVPKTIGIGPIITAPPPLTLPPLILDMRRMAKAMIKVRIPNKIRVKPRPWRGLALSVKLVEAISKPIKVWWIGGF